MVGKSAGTGGSSNRSRAGNPVPVNCGSSHVPSPLALPQERPDRAAPAGSFAEPGQLQRHAPPRRSARACSCRRRRTTRRRTNGRSRPSRRRRSAPRRIQCSGALDHVVARRAARRAPRPRTTCRRCGSRPSARTTSPTVSASHADTASPRAMYGSSLVAAEHREHLEHVRGDVLGRRIEHRAEIRERHAVEQLARVVAIERGPRAVARSHRARPLDGAFDGSRTASGSPPSSSASTTTCVSSTSG